GSNTVDRYLLAGKSMPWYAMALSIMATQASAITFLSTTGQSYVDGMRFVQFYFGLPIAMVIICATVVPVFHHAKVYTAYEYLERPLGWHVSVPLVLRLRPVAGAAISDREVDCAEPAGPAVQRHREDPDAVFHPVHRRYGVRVLRFRGAAAAVPRQ